MRGHLCTKPSSHTALGGGAHLLHLPDTQLGRRVILSLGCGPRRLRCSVRGPPRVRRAGGHIRAGLSADERGVARPPGLTLPGGTCRPFQQVRWHAGSARVCCRGQRRPRVPQQRACQQWAACGRRGGRPGPAGAPGSGRLRAARCWQPRWQQAAMACPGGAGCLCAVLLLQHCTLWRGFILRRSRVELSKVRWTFKLTATTLAYLGVLCRCRASACL